MQFIPLCLFLSYTQLDDEEERMDSLLNLALLSRSRAMLARVLSWGHAFGGPDFAWSWRALGAHGITPLLRVQVRQGGGVSVRLGWFATAFTSAELEIVKWCHHLLAYCVNRALVIGAHAGR